MQIRALSPIFCTGEAISHICLSLCDAMRSASTDVGLLVPASARSIRHPFARDAVPWFLTKVAYRLDPETRRIVDYTARKFLNRIQAGDIAYVWPGSPLWLYRELKARGHTLIMERINCHRMTARRILDDAYARLGLPPTHGITDDATAEECEKLSLADRVFSPAPNVTTSLISAGVDISKILPASYGWSPERLGIGDRAAAPKSDRITFLYVGRICVRKGAHLLLKAWSKAGVSGRLILAGAMDQEIAATCERFLARDDVVVLPHTRDIGKVYRSADIFAFPTLEEGSPLVVYEAMASGLPVLTTQMGGGDVVREGVDGLILDAYNTEAWVQLFRSFAHNRDRIHDMGQSAASRAADYHWSAVGARRERMLRESLRAPATPALAC